MPDTESGNKCDVLRGREHPDPSLALAEEVEGVEGALSAMASGIVLGERQERPSGFPAPARS